MAVETDPFPPDFTNERRADGWQNDLTGLGTSRDKVYGGSFFAPYRLQDQELLALFNGSDIAARVVETRPKAMLKRGYDIDADPTKVEGQDDTPEVDEEELADLQKQFQRLRGDELVTDGGVWGGLFGGALLIVGAEDGQTVDKPLNEKNIKTIRYLNLVDRRFVQVQSYYNDPLKPNYGLAETYMVNQTISGSGTTPGTVVVHESRCIRFDGARTDILTRLQLSGWSWSLLQRAYDSLRSFETGFQACSNLMTDASQAVFKMSGLINMIASNDKDTLQARMAAVDMSRSVCRAVLIDAESEDFERKPTTFAGLPDLLDRFMMRLSAAVDIPVSILMGRSAAGMNATGDNDFRAFYDSVANDQEIVLAPKLRRLYRLMALAKDSPMTVKDLEFKIKFHELWEPSDTEQADVELKTAQRDTIYANMGAVTPEVIALSRWGKGSFNGAGMVAFDPATAQKTMDDEKMMGHMLEPPKELLPGAQEAQAAAAAVPGQPGQQPVEPPVGQSPYGLTKDPRQVVKQMHEPVEEPGGSRP